VKPILETIELLLRVEKRATPQMITRASGLPYRKVLEVLDKNRDSIEWGKRAGEIKRLRLADRVQNAKREAERRGEAYWVSKCDWGYGPEILVFSGPLFEQMAQPRWEGGIGDSHKYMRVLNTPENLEKVREAGLVHLNELQIDPSSFWEEP
jgi:hypothetical protein